MTEPDPSDLQTTVRLVARAQGGDRAALEQLFVRYMPRVRRIVALRMGWRMSQFFEVEDMAQEALIRVLEGLESFEQKSEGHFRNWLALVIEREIKTHARRNAAQKRGEGKLRRFADWGSEVFLSSILAADQPSPSAVAQQKDLELHVEEALLELPEHAREVIILRFLCDLSYAEVAEAMGFEQETTARKAVSRALQRLRERLAARGPGDTRSD